MADLWLGGPGGALMLKLVSTEELSASPGSVELGLTLRLVSAVWGNGGRTEGCVEGSSRERGVVKVE